jgi:hypothetical protein
MIDINCEDVEGDLDQEADYDLICEILMKKKQANKLQIKR